MIFENTQPPIVEESVFLIVQNIRRSRRRATNFTEEQKYLICSTYRKGKDLCTTHSIKNVVLHEIVLRNLREAIEFVTQYEAEFVKEAADSRCGSATRSFPASVILLPKPKAGLPNWITCSSIYTRTM
ncbi:MAG: Site-specific recombinase [Mesotoga prima]|uniref:Site-specific recombinase n=1 Tax=Mesotoga prima TaxID=1184387 RepID=A0A101HR83_9BACT|nr:MAG: Site-specific recombinase [Mesotoga prima]